MEKASFGSPAMHHDWILIGSPNVLVSENSDEQGMSFDWNEQTRHILQQIKWTIIFTKETNIDNFEAYLMSKNN